MGERPGRRIALFIGPEGGFEPEEVQSLVEKGGTLSGSGFSPIIARSTRDTMSFLPPVPSTRSTPGRAETFSFATSL